MNSPVLFNFDNCELTDFLTVFIMKYITLIQCEESDEDDEVCKSLSENEIK